MFTKRCMRHKNDVSIVLTEDGVNAKRIAGVEDSKDFEFNAFGFPLNDIAALNGAKSLQEYMAVLDRLKEYEAQNPDNSKLSMREKIASIFPRSFQTPAELDLAARVVGQFWQDVSDVKVDAVRSAAAAKVAKAAKPASPSSPEYVTTPTAE